MVIFGMAFGALLFYFGSSPVMPLVEETAGWKVALAFLAGCMLIPLPPSLDIRGWDEMHPLNGPAWSLFFEYVANILYALVIRRFSKAALGAFVFIAGANLLWYCITSASGDIVGGWSVDSHNLYLGLTRLLYPFFAGLLLFRLGATIKLRRAFPLTALALAAAMAFPRIGGEGAMWANGLFEAACILFLFPAIVAAGAGSKTGALGKKMCKVLGGISYPLYITHYPVVYAYTAWVANEKVTIAQGLPILAAIWLACVVFAYLVFEFYDKPVRKYLSARFSKKAAN